MPTNSASISESPYHTQNFSPGFASPGTSHLPRAVALFDTSHSALFREDLAERSSFSADSHRLMSRSPSLTTSLLAIGFPFVVYVSRWLHSPQRPLSMWWS